MQIITGKLDGFTDAYPLSRLGKREEILAVDIETTGLSPEKARVYLIGCAYWEDGGWKTIQWFDDHGDGESDILTSFILFAKRYKVLLHYNGDRFDLPFLSRRIVWNGLQGLPGAENFPSGMQSADLYRFLKPYQKVLSLPDLKQKTVERFVGTGRTEKESGGDLIRVYERYLAARKAEGNPIGEPDSSGLRGVPSSKERNNGDETVLNEKGKRNSSEEKSEASAESGDDVTTVGMREMLIAHNAADIAGLIGISDVIAYDDLFRASLNVYKAQANTYRNAEGNPVQELWMYARAEHVPDDVLKNPVTTSRDGCFITVTGNKVTIKVPIYNGKAYYFYANYKDYYYLPELDQAIHKSIATFVDARRREQATARNCYTAKVGGFLPEWTTVNTGDAGAIQAKSSGIRTMEKRNTESSGLRYEPFFKRSYDDPTAWFSFTDDMKKDRKFFSEYATYIYHHVVQG